MHAFNAVSWFTYWAARYREEAKSSRPFHKAAQIKTFLHFSFDLKNLFAAVTLE